MKEGARLHKDSIIMATNIGTRAAEENPRYRGKTHTTKVTPTLPRKNTTEVKTHAAKEKPMLVMLLNNKCGLQKVWQ